MWLYENLGHRTKIAKLWDPRARDIISGREKSRGAVWVTAGENADAQSRIKMFRTKDKTLKHAMGKGKKNMGARPLEYLDRKIKEIN